LSLIQLRRGIKIKFMQGVKL